MEPGKTPSQGQPHRGPRVQPPKARLPRQVNRIDRMGDRLDAEAGSGFGSEHQQARVLGRVIGSDAQ